ncbi:unnamed protein product [Kuraishia capsulata CBS 1993]|uniref:Thiamine phosphate synthase/TenI domain-containing protein n=1 Tax=Kuraishia capsulata CBS 1993 TaxID=1382522 RepID=W6MXV1_9ASCO|nr:uncharacterized protein KUCA_T00005517001 [Kuraishia capsulata CBS 1993]CDK29525.1 unnamed protein product [Kuraishia capsulata CBS 1993]
MARQSFDLSVYLVTNAEMVPEGIDFVTQVERAIEGGVTIVQLREKNLETREFIERARQVHKLTKKAGIPLIINDRVDVALAIDCEGVHVGQDDMPVPLVRKLIGPDKIIGVSTGYVDEVKQAALDEADYIGIGAVFATQTKKLKKIPFGTEGIRRLLGALKESNALHMKTCVIGGINGSNIQRVNLLGRIEGKKVDGFAVVSCIMANNDAKTATLALKQKIDTLPSWATPKSTRLSGDEIDASIGEKTPMVHHITNDVVKNFSANVTLAVGGSPIMSECREEFGEFASIPNSALVLNTGTLTDAKMDIYIAAIEAYNKVGTPIVYDPVGAGASEFRRHAVRQLLNSGYFSVIKGNEGEISAVAGLTKQMKGVDNVGSSSIDDIVEMAKKVAYDNKCVVVVTGVADVVAGCVFSGEDEPDLEYKIIQGGHPMMGQITGTGCSLGSAIAVSVAANPESPFYATVRAVEKYKEAGKVAGTLASGTKGPGTFVTSFLDALATRGQ